jgi:hypothetical protein
MGFMQDRIEPIKKKFEFITDDNFSDIGNVELSEEDKMALASLDSAWKQFTLGMSEAKAIIQKTFTDFKNNMQENIEEYKKEVDDNLINFQKMAPWQAAQDFTDNNNAKAFEMINHFTKECDSFE